MLKRNEQIVTGAYGKKRMIDGETYADRGIAKVSFESENSHPKWNFRIRFDQGQIIR